MADTVTIGITSFERPESLATLLASINRNRPIIVVDNSRVAPVVPDNVKLVSLPFDAGLAACRNELMRTADTEYVLLCEDDFIFTSHTRIDWLLRTMMVLRPYGVNVISGSVCNGSPTDAGSGWLQGMYRHNRTLILANGPTGMLADYPTADLTINFCLIRRETALDHPWPEALKQGEHLAWFWHGKCSGALRIAHCPQVRILHKHTGNAFYNEHRSRLIDFRTQWLRSAGFDDIKRVR